jgi:exonuclease SbcC
MVPLQLSLKNFLSYSEYAPTLDFRGFNIACLSGKNGQGKSALLDALTWVLWGKCRAKNKEEIIKRGAREARVELEFELDGNRYRVLRTITRKRGSATSASLEFQVFDTGAQTFRPLSQGVKAQEEIERVLRMDYDSFICSAFILQGRADEFTKKTPAERKDVLSRILGLERYEALAKRARELAQESKLEGERVEREINNFESEISEKDNLVKKLNETKTEEDNITNEIREKEKLHEGIIRESEALRSKTETYKRLTREKEDIQRRLNRLKEDKDRLDVEIQKDKEIISREKEILQHYNELLEVREEEGIFSERLLSHTRFMRELDEVNRLIYDEKTKIEKELSSLKGREKELENRLTQIKSLLDREGEINSGFEEFLYTQSLEKELDEKRRITEKLKLRENELKSDIQKISIQIEAKNRELEAKVKELSKKADNKQSLDAEYNKLKAKIRACEDLKERCDSTKIRLKETAEEKRGLISRAEEIKKIEKEEREKLRIIRAEAHKPHCPLCESPLSDEIRDSLLKKLERSLLDKEKRLEEEYKKITQLENDEKRMEIEIKTAEEEIKTLPANNKKLGEIEKGLKDSMDASKDLEQTKDELDKLKDMLEKEDFAIEQRKELKILTQEILDTAYKGEQHEAIKQKLESLRRFQGENERLKEAKTDKNEVENQVGDIEIKTAHLVKTLEKESFATNYRREALEIQRKITEVGYDEEKHKELKSILKSLEGFAKEKEALDRAKLSLSLREKEKQNLNVRLNTEGEQLEKTEKEIRELEEVIAQSEALEKKKKAMEDEISDLKKIKDEIVQEKSRFNSKLEWIAGLEGKREEAKKQSKKLAYDTVVYQELDKAFGKNGIQALIIESSIPEIDIEANKILSRLTDGGMTLSLEMVKPTQKGGEKETLEIKVGDNFGTRSYETFSGGEAFRIDFALRIAISKFIANRSGAELRTLVIDEGFGTQDKDGLSQFVEAINNIKNDFDKILVITHIDELKDKFPVKIEVTKEIGRGSTFEIIYS